MKKLRSKEAFSLGRTESVGARRRAWLRVLVLLLAAQCTLVSARAQYGQPPESSLPQGGTPDVLKAVGIDQRLNEQVPLDLKFRDEAGREVRLGDYFQRGRPVVLTLVYYECPMMCKLVLDDLTGALQALNFTAGKEFEVVTVSFDPREGPAQAAAKKEVYLKRYGRPGAEAGWHFLTGDAASIERLTQAVGFRYAWDARSQQFAHASALMVVTPEGKLSHYFYGLEYSPKDLRLAMVEASSGKIGSPVDQLILYCYHYDPTTGRYGPVIMNIMRVAGILTVLGLVALILFLRRWRRPDAEKWEESINVGGAA